MFIFELSDSSLMYADHSLDLMWIWYLCNIQKISIQSGSMSWYNMWNDTSNCPLVSIKLYCIKHFGLVILGLASNCQYQLFARMEILSAGCCSWGVKWWCCNFQHLTFEISLIFYLLIYFPDWLLCEVVRDARSHPHLHQPAALWWCIIPSLC